MAERQLGFRDAGRSEPSAVDGPVAAGAVRLDDRAAAALLPDRPKRGHKGTFGKVLVIAGSLDYAGAALLVCRAAGRAGAGLVTLAIPESLQPLFAAKVVEATTMALPEDGVESVDPDLAIARILDHDHDAIVLGPGLRPGLATAELVRLLIAAGTEATPAPVVLDAEALRSMATLGDWWTEPSRPAVLTPHPGEFGRLLEGAGLDRPDADLSGDDEARSTAARDAAAAWRQVVVLKGAATVVAEPSGGIAVAPFENPALATGGTGDVLAGTIGALLGQGLPPFDAARLGVYLHGLAGDIVRDRLGDAGLMASDLPEVLPMARKRLSAVAERARSGRRLGFGARAPAGSGDADMADAAAAAGEAGDGSAGSGG